MTAHQNHIELHGVSSTWTVGGGCLVLVRRIVHENCPSYFCWDELLNARHHMTQVSVEDTTPCAAHSATRLHPPQASRFLCTLQKPACFRFVQFVPQICARSKSLVRACLVLCAGRKHLCGSIADRLLRTGCDLRSQ